MRFIPTVFLVSFTIVGQSQMAFSQQPISKGEWTFKNEKPVSVTFDYGTELTAKEVDQLSKCASLTQIVMGYAGVDSEYVEIEGDLLKLGRLENLQDVHLNKDGINDDDLKFVALLPKIHTLEFNADNGYDGAPICTDRCADHLSSAKTLRSLVIHEGQFTDKFVAKITQGLPNLEALTLNSAELTDESLRLLSERCKKLKSLSIASDHFTAKGLKHLDKLKNLKRRAVSSPALRKKSNPKEVLKLLGTWEYVSATYEGKPRDVGKNETITLTEGNWTLRRNGKFISSSTWEIDSTRSPKWLTQFTEGGKVNFVDRWVYKFDGEQLVLCKSSWIEERPRPDRFESRKGDNQYLLVLRRRPNGERPEDTADKSSNRDGQMAYLGVVPDLGVDVRGVRVDGLSPSSPCPAAKAGLKKGDVIIQLGTVPVADVDSLVKALRKYKAGQTVEITLNRGRQKLQVQVTLGTHPNRRTTQGHPGLQRLKADQDLAVTWFKTAWMARVEYTERRVTGLVFPGFSNVTDEVLDVVATFPDLESLAVVGAQVTDSGWKSLAKLQNLRKLAIISTRTFTDEEMKYLAGLRKLEVLDLSSTKQVTDAGIESIKGLTSLRDVDLDFTKVTDRSLELLSGNEGLEKLWLTSTPISDEGMKSLAKFQRLRQVDLQSTNVTDEGLQRLRACKELKHLFVNSTKITKEGAKRFHQTLPKCEIVFAPTDIGG